MDSLFHSLHFLHPNQALYIETWQDLPISYDPIDTGSLFDAASAVFPHLLDTDEDDDLLPINLSTFGAKFNKSRQLNNRKVWSDVLPENLKAMLSRPKLEDETILRPMRRTNEVNVAIDDFLANGYKAETEDRILEESWLNTTDLQANHTFSMKMRSNSVNSIHTPRIRTRQVSLDKFQTPVARIIR